MGIPQEGAKRLALAGLWANGGCEAILRLPGLASIGNDAEQLGLATPQFQDVPIGPVVWRKLGVDTALLVAASALEKLSGAPGFADAESLLQAAVGVVIEGVLYAITKCEALSVAGAPCMYRVSVKAPVWV